jgi:hypothetical protein
VYRCAAASVMDSSYASNQFRLDSSQILVSPLLGMWARRSLKGERSGSCIPKLGSLFKPCLSILKRQMRPAPLWDDRIRLCMRARLGDPSPLGTACLGHSVSQPTLGPLGQPEKAMGHESQIELWSPNLNTVLLCWFRNGQASSQRSNENR